MPKVLVTGAGKRLGKGIALNFARKGWDVIVHYNKSEEGAKEVLHKINDTGQMGYLFQADLREADTIENKFEEVFENFGVPAVLVNNAGVFPEKKDTLDFDVDDWNFIMNINARSQFLTSKVFAKHAYNGSRIINIASLGGVEIWKNKLPYHASKAAAIHQSRALANDLAPAISVNSINPGVIVVPENENDVPKPKEEKIPMQRYGTIDDLFSAVYFFATCSPYITGQNISVDGGQHYSR